METAIKTQDKISVKSLLESDKVKGKFQEMLGKKAQGFITSVLQIQSQNELLAKADPASIVNAAMVAATLDLPLNNNLGFAYIVPYNTRQPDGTYKQVAQFQMGYKGFIQLAQRSGQFKTIACTEIYEGQLVDSNPLTGFVFDFSKKKSDTIIGFAAYFSLINGFEKTFYMTVEEMKSHGLKYSKTFKNGLWNTDFVSMGNKTILKLLLSKFAPLSIEMQKAVMSDQGVIKDDETVQYVDHEEIKIDKELERVVLMLSDCKTIEDVELLQESHPDLDIEMFNKRKEELNGRK